MNTATLHSAAPAPSIRADGYDCYGPIHKGIRYALSTLLLRLGSASWGDRSAVAALLRDVRRQMVLAREHLEQEERFYHATLAGRLPGGVQRLEMDHDRHREDFGRIEHVVRQVEAADDATRGAHGHALYLAMSAYIAEDFAHMHYEETVTLKQFHAHFSDDEIRAMENAVVMSLEPEQFIGIMQMIIPGMSREDRAHELAMIRDGAPEDDFKAVMEHAARATLSPADYADLCSRLGVSG